VRAGPLPGRSSGNRSTGRPRATHKREAAKLGEANPQKPLTTETTDTSGRALEGRRLAQRAVWSQPSGSRKTARSVVLRGDLTNVTRRCSRVAANGRPLGRAGDLALDRTAFRRAPEWAVRGQAPPRRQVNEVFLRGFSGLTKGS
jgi:hypothetical protein